MPCAARPRGLGLVLEETGRDEIALGDGQAHGGDIDGTTLPISR